ncbi:MAG: LamG domain-containing protein [Verrucomicrobia bacterium]|nr:LamG domain-containing protein [Verrucomicrobiota bacterium]
MKTSIFQRIVLIALACCGWAMNGHTQTPPVVRSTEYNGAHSNVVYYAAQPWMNTNTTLLTVEAWIYCRDLIGNQALVARHYSTNLYFGLAGNKLRFYRSGGTFADSDGSVVAGRWTHVATTYDGTTARFYINGVAAGTKGLANAGNNSTNRLSLGGQRDILNLGDALAGGFAFNGYLDEVRLWTVVRSQSQISTSMYEEVRSGTGLLATFGTGGRVNELQSGNGSTDGIAVDLRSSGFGILPTDLRIPFSSGALRADGVVDMLNEYRGAETIVLRSTLNGTTPDQRGYLMVSTNSTNFHLYVAVPDIQQSGFLPPPTMQVAGNVNLANGTTNGIGDWEGRLTQDSFQGGTIFGVNPPFFPTPQWLSWGQSTQNWQAATTSPYEFHQDYEFRIHGRHLNYFSNSVGLLVRYYGFNGAEQLVAPRGGVTNRPDSYATAEWGGVANVGLVNVSISGEVNNVTTGGNQSGWTVTLRSGASALGGVIIRTLPVAADGTFTISGDVPREQAIHLILEARSGYTFVPPEYLETSSGREAVTITGNSTLTYSACTSGGCTYRSVRFRVQSPPGPLALTSVAPLSVPATVLVRTTPRKTTPVGNLTLTGANLHSGIRVFFRGSGCFEDPPNFCSSDWVEGEIVSTAFDRTSVVVAVPELPGTGVVARNFQIVVENPLYLSTLGSRWTYGPTVSVTPPIYAHLYGFEFRK